MPGPPLFGPLHIAAVKALRTATMQYGQQQHVPVLLGLTLIAMRTMVGE